MHIIFYYLVPPIILHMFLLSYYHFEQNCTLNNNITYPHIAAHISLMFSTIVMPVYMAYPLTIYTTVSIQPPSQTWQGDNY
jgi:hypothetical protein